MAVEQDQRSANTESAKGKTSERRSTVDRLWACRTEAVEWKIAQQIGDGRVARGVDHLAVEHVDRPEAGISRGLDGLCRGRQHFGRGESPWSHQTKGDQSRAQKNGKNGNRISSRSSAHVAPQLCPL
ncbi:MAG: hypothetical protein V2J10_03765 [Wenzhouxiangella sp.]|nr:hypothetical protein [Wenzhouxiangella sp.]